MSKVVAKELTDATVSHISLVDRGANREPFRIIKAQGDDKMLDFSNGFRGLFQKADRAPKLALVAFSKQFDPAAAAQILGEAGIEHGDAVLTDTALVFPLGEDAKPDLEGIVLFKVDDHIAIGMQYPEPEVVQKSFTGYDYESTDFKQVLGTNTTLPMIGISMSALSDTIWNIMANADTANVAKSDIKAALKDFGATVLEIVDRVPATAFKLEAAASKVGTVLKADDAGQATSTDEDGGKKPEDKPADKPEEEKPEEKPADQPEGDGGDEAKPEEKPEGEPKPEEKPAEGGKEPTAKTDEAPKGDDPVLAAISKLGETLDGKITALAATVTKQGEGLAAVSASVKKMDADLGLNVLGGDTPEEEPVEVVKVDLEDGEEATEDGFLVLDTAYQDPFRPEERRAAR